MLSSFVVLKRLSPRKVFLFSVVVVSRMRVDFIVRRPIAAAVGMRTEQESTTTVESELPKMVLELVVGKMADQLVQIDEQVLRMPGLELTVPAIPVCPAGPTGPGPPCSPSPPCGPCCPGPPGKPGEPGLP